MKKILLSVGLFSLVLVGRAQTILNELYVEPSPSTNEFFELYYAGTLPIGDNVDCWTLISYFNTGGQVGVYVMDLPNVSTGFSNRYMVGASSDPFTAQGSTNVHPNFNWNAMPASGRITKWTVSGGVWTQQADPVNLLDFFNNKGNGGFNYSALMYVNGSFQNGFLGGTNQSTSSILTGLPNLNLTTANSNVCAPFTVVFSALPALEHVTSAAGTDNGYNRSADGKCGSWSKSSSSAEHTPGASNGATGLTGEIIFNNGNLPQAVLSCNTGPGVSRVTYNITGVGGSATEADDFPVEVQLWYDNPPLGVQDGSDVYQSSLFDATIADPAKSFTISQVKYSYLIVRTKRGCFDKVIFVPNGCAPLPVSFKSFTATRFSSNVMVKWETAWEQNNSGFAVERNDNGTWRQVAWVTSQAAAGNSNDLLSYTYNDPNNVKGITQYRIRQVDLDTKSKYSEVRSVRGEGQLSKTTVYPNPTSDGKINVVFEDGSAKRNVTVYDMSGRTIKEFKSITNNNITIENLQPGVYTLKVIVPETGEQAVQKFVVNQR